MSETTKAASGTTIERSVDTASMPKDKSGKSLQCTYIFSTQDFVIVAYK